MTPKTKDKYLGIEIECCIPYPEAVVNFIAEHHGYKLGKNFYLDGDSSVHNIYENTHEKYTMDPWSEGFEIKLLIKQSNLKKEMVRLNSFLKKVEAVATKECGLHVHLDTRNTNSRDIIQNLLDNEYQILAASPQKRLIARESYCRPLNNITLNNVVLRYELSKYSSVNFLPLATRNTIEVRTHEGCVNAKEIYNWCKMLIEIAYEGKVSYESEKYIAKRFVA